MLYEFGDISITTFVNVCDVLYLYLSTTYDLVYSIFIHTYIRVYFQWSNFICSEGSLTVRS